MLQRNQGMLPLALAQHADHYTLQVMVEYAPAEVDTFIAFADAVEEEFEGVMVDGVEVRRSRLFLAMLQQLGCRS